MNPEDFTNPLVVLAAAIVAILGAGRFARLIVQDTWPPAALFRVWWDRVTNYGPWSTLAHCHWCAAPWAMLMCIGWFGLGLILAPILIAWWVFWGWLALAYVASIVAAYDEPGNRED
jgi:hypothetical protein